MRLVSLFLGLMYFFCSSVAPQRPAQDPSQMTTHLHTVRTDRVAVGLGGTGFKPGLLHPSSLPHHWAICPPDWTILALQRYIFSTLSQLCSIEPPFFQLSHFSSIEPPLLQLNHLAFIEPPFLHGAPFPRWAPTPLIEHLFSIEPLLLRWIISSLLSCLFPHWATSLPVEPFLLQGPVYDGSILHFI